MNWSLIKLHFKCLSSNREESSEYYPVISPFSPEQSEWCQWLESSSASNYTAQLTRKLAFEILADYIMATWNGHISLLSLSQTQGEVSMTDAMIAETLLCIEDSTYLFLWSIAIRCMLYEVWSVYIYHMYICSHCLGSWQLAGDFQPDSWCCERIWFTAGVWPL